MRLVRWCAAGAGLATVHTVVNAALLRRPSERPMPAALPVSVLLPMRDEATQIVGCLTSLLDQRGVPDMEIVILDDGSADNSAAIARAVAGADPRVRVLTGEPLPPGWLGKPYACQQLADVADPASEVLVFVDADVVFAPHAIASTVDCLLRTELTRVRPLRVPGSALSSRFSSGRGSPSCHSVLQNAPRDRRYLPPTASCSRCGMRRTGGRADTPWRAPPSSKTWR
jgi:hypothetical protein